MFPRTPNQVMHEDFVSEGQMDFREYNPRPRTPVVEIDPNDRPYLDLLVDAGQISQVPKVDWKRKKGLLQRYFASFSDNEINGIKGIRSLEGMTPEQIGGIFNGVLKTARRKRDGYK